MAENRGDASQSTLRQIGYAPANGLQLYYEVHGRGQPLVLIHGGFGVIGILTHTDLLLPIINPFLDAPG